MPYKLKNEIKFKDLKKIGYKKDNGYYRKYDEGYRVQIHSYYKDILVYKYRENSDWGDFIGHLKEDDEEIKAYIQDLIKADLVEKVKDFE